MKIRLLSDLHLEFFSFAIPPMEGDSGTVLVLAGDIAPIARRDLLENFLLEAAARFRHVCFVPGNHEYYGSIWPDALHALREWHLPANVHVLDRDSVQVDDVVFLGATLWTDMNGADTQAMQLAQEMLFDYRVISQPPVSPGSGESVSLTPQCTVDEHSRCRQWIEASMRQLSREERKVVLISHHGVTLDSVHERFRGNPLNPAFVSDMSSLLLSHPPTLVVHGHVHNSFSYRVAGAGPRVVVNPRGYMRKDGTLENPEFDPCLVLEI
jgi:hypothetical protein